ncbi:hypothetical protein ACFLVO_02380 [Chloroflexota bacterium]
MTLNITISRPEGVIQSSDHRVIWNGHLKDTISKHVLLWTYDGFILVTFCGVAALRSGWRIIRIEDWLAGVLTKPPKSSHEESEKFSLKVLSVKESTRIIESEATKQLGNVLFGMRNSGLWFSVGGQSFEKRFIGFITNMNPKSKATDRPNAYFKTYVDWLPEDVSAALYVPRDAVTTDDSKRLNQIIKAKKVLFKDLDRLLSSVHRNAAAYGSNRQLVSASCTTTYTDDSSPTLGFRGVHHGLAERVQGAFSIEPKVITWGVPSSGLWADIWCDGRKEA